MQDGDYGIREYSGNAAYARFIASYETFIVAFRELYTALERFGAGRLEPLELVHAIIVQIGASYAETRMSDPDATVVTEDGNTFSVRGIIEWAFDTLKLIIDYAAYKRRSGKTISDEPLDLGAFFSLSNVYRWVKRDWQDCLWLDNFVNVEPEVNPTVLDSLRWAEYLAVGWWVVERRGYDVLRWRIGMEHPGIFRAIGGHESTWLWSLIECDCTGTPLNLDKLRDLREFSSQLRCDTVTLITRAPCPPARFLCGTPLDE